MVGTESGPEGGDNDRRRFLVLATKLGLAVPPVVTLALARRSYAAGSGFKADVVFDLVGGEVLARSSALLKPGGTLVSVVSWELPADRDDIKTVFFIQEAKQVQLTELARLVDAGHLRPQVGGVYPLAQAAEAYSAKAAGGIPGRMVLQP